MVKVQGWAPPGGQNIIQTWKKEARKPKRLGKTWTTVQRATPRLSPLEEVDEVHQPNSHLIVENSDKGLFIYYVISDGGVGGVGDFQS